MGGPQRPYVRQLLTPALRMMDTMLERHKRERSRPSTARFGQ
ncbi:hypothetical protein DUNSADRAFT_923 [Dunaliella salina]|uniref:Encoded protein n=1 Tax=Dunaliella salina TaxID=3046 RepID=A0ABQ7H8R3_DUNSA|nr:hypothetical protein DUNSADRAFT_923 [Dunaliella salina]|eukprot:KAF5843247.1 hypothetical protein DUNSADRAFT_923 [Dunaliella salina]